MSGSPGLVARALRLFRECPLPYLAAAALPYFTVHLLLWALLYSLLARQFTPGTPLRELMQSLSSLQLAEVMLALLMFVTVPYALAGRSLCRLSSRQIENSPATFGEVLADMILFLPSAVLLSLIVGIAAGIGMGALFLPGILIAAFFTLVIPAGAIENLGPFVALKRGLNLASRAFGRLLGLYFTFALTVLVAFILQSVLFSGLPNTLSARFPIFVLITCIPLFPLVIFNICLTLIFYELRGTTISPRGPVPFT